LFAADYAALMLPWLPLFRACAADVFCHAAFDFRRPHLLLSLTMTSPRLIIYAQFFDVLLRLSLISSPLAV